ncbi:M48 family metallopeptidase [Actinoplanes rectilineatus]|uniref:M48 family metallopeptidase n=1 Tax=Actinoplanes rectilineatus TaxID=113571 RepID=UPI0005F2FA62|nr:M48 family metallopeptidase [Actinoplanes rectilineatus]
MSNDARAAARSAAALAGFLVVAGLQLALVLLALWIVLKLLPSTFALRAGVPLSIATFGALAYATWRAVHTRMRVPAGAVVPRDRAPQLWELIDGAAKAAGVPAPDGVTVVADATLVLGERARALGLVGGRRDLYLGLPLLQAWEPATLRAAVAHELAHGSPKLGRWAPLAYRGRIVVGRKVPRISRRNPAGVVLRAYAGFYRRVDAPFSRAQELAADRIAAAHAGTEAAVTAIRDLPALAGMQRLFHAEYLGPGWQAGYVPDDVFGGLLRVLAARTGEMEMLRTQQPEANGAWDTHPSMAERLAALTAPAPEPSGAVSDPSSPPSAPSPAPSASSESASSESAPESSASTSDETAEPAGDLVPDLPALGRALQAVAFPPRGRTVVSWDECLSVARTTEMEREADAALATISRAAGTTVTDAASVLELAADGRLRTAAESIFPEEPAEQTTERIVELLGLMFALAALRSGVVRWRHSWTGAAEVVGAQGAYLNLAELSQAAAVPEMVGSVREYFAQIGVDLAAPAGATAAARAQVLGGLVGLSADGERTDLLITDRGLFLVPGLPRGRVIEAKKRLTRIASDGVPSSPGVPAPTEPKAGKESDPKTEVTDPKTEVTDGPKDVPKDEPKPERHGDGRFVPFADVAGVTTLPGRRKGWVIGLRDGGSMTLKPALDADELPGGWAAWDDTVAYLTGSR